MSTFHEVARRYQVAQGWCGERCVLEDAQLRALSDALAALARDLGDATGHEEWRSALGYMKRVRWEGTTLPIPLRRDGLTLATNPVNVADVLRRAEVITPGSGRAAAAAAEALDALRNSDRDPLGDLIRELCRPVRSFMPADSVSIVLPGAQHCAEVTDAITGGRGGVMVVPQSRAPHLPVHYYQVIVGAPHRIPPDILRATRAWRVVFVYPSWLRDEPVDLGLLPGSHLFARITPRGPALPPPVGSHEDGLDWEPIPDWDALSAHDPGPPVSTSVLARGFLLASGDAVYLPVEGHSRTDTVSVAPPVNVHPVPTADVGAGDFLVVRIGGDGSYVADIANALLGESAKSLRVNQALWKSRLHDAVMRRGMDRVVEDLVDAGCSVASVGNVRSWLTSERLATRSEDDFRALMDVVGLPAETEDIWAAMLILRGAHQRAGHLVRRRLRAAIASAALDNLCSRGWDDFELAEIEGEGALRVARVVAVAPSDVVRSVTSCHRLIPGGQVPWR